MIPSRKALGLAVRASRETLQWTLRHFAGKTPLTLSTIARSERGERDIGYVEFLCLATALGMTEGTLLNLAQQFQDSGLLEAHLDVELALVGSRLNCIQAAMQARATSCS